MIAIEESYSLKSYNTFALPVRARFFAEADQKEDLRSVMSIFSQNPLPKLVLGGGSNLLFTNDFEGVVIYPGLTGIEVTQENAEHVWVKAYASENWDNFVNTCVANSWGGLENLSNIPGNVGACPIQNIGAYGVEVKNCIESVEGIRFENCEDFLLPAKECRFGYRDSIFKREWKNKAIITAVNFKLSKKGDINIKYADVKEALLDYSEITLDTVRKAICSIRKRKLPDPMELGNAGSFFKNPIISTELFITLKEKYPFMPSFPVDQQFVKIPAAWLIETSGWKGRKDGNVGTYPTQPLVIVNYGNASGTEILKFAEKIQASVRNEFQIDLEMEVNIIH